MQTASTQCWWMAQVLRSHIRWRLVVSSDEMSSCLSFTNFCDWPSVDRNLPTAPYDYIDLRLLSNVTSVESLTTKHGWTYHKAEFVDKQSPPQYNMFSCFMLQVPQTFYLSVTSKQRGFIHDYNVSFQHSSILSSKLFLNCRPWRHRLVMILWLNLQQNRLLQCKQSHEANASKRVRQFYRCQQLKAIYKLYI